MRLLAALLIFSAIPASSGATELKTALDGLTKISFGRESALAIGDTVDVLDPSVPRQRCVKFDNDQVVLDSSGAIDSKISYRLIRDLDQFENTFKVTYTVESTSSANLAKIVSGESTLKTFGSFENFIKRDKESLLIIIEASALHGRDFVRDFELKEEYKALLNTNDWKQFRAKCGTHFVRGWNRKSALSVVIQVDNLSTQGKIAIEGTMNGSLSGTLNVTDVLGASGKVSVATTMAGTLKLANQLGKVSVRVEAVGGAGIGTVAAVVNSGNVSDPNFTPNLLTAIASAARDFTVQNAAPDQFILIAHPQISSGVVEFDGVNFDRLHEIYRALVRIDQRMELYNAYRDRDYNLWSTYFRVEGEKITLLRDTLAKMYQRCRNNGDCSGEIPSTIDGVILEDILTNAEFKMECIHSYSHEDVINGQVADRFRYLSSMAVFWKGDVNFLKSIEPDTARVSMITPDFVMHQLPFEPTRSQLIRAEPNGDRGRLLLDLHRESIDPSKVINDGEISLDALRDARSRVAQSVFVIRYKTINGNEIEQALGKPGIGGCPITLSH